MDSLNKQEHSEKYSPVVTTYASYLILAEIGIGSFMHAFHFPFTGYILSLNQIFLITRALIASKEMKNVHLSSDGNISRYLPSSMSSSAALLKTLAPLGKKLTPMIAISMQGLLYNLGTLLCGNNPIGRCLGASLSSLWGFVQPILLYYLIFGSSLYIAMIQFISKMQDYFGVSKYAFIFLAIFLVLLKMGFACLIVILTPLIPQSKFEVYMAKLGSIKPHHPEIIPNNEKKSLLFTISKAIKDVFHPIFLFSIVFTSTMLYFVENSPNWFIWGLLRPAAMGFVCFFLLRFINLEKYLKSLKIKI